MWKFFTNKIFSILDWIDQFTDEYSDTISLFLITIGGIAAAVAIGTLPHGGTTDGYDFVYLKKPFIFHLGLIAIVFGFINQFVDTLTSHHASKKVTYWISGILFFYLIIYILLN